jgi:hypothetical protein
MIAVRYYGLFLLIAYAFRTLDGSIKHFARVEVWNRKEIDIFSLYVRMFARLIFFLALKQTEPYYVLVQ